jgi:hypothetical protein
MFFGLNPELVLYDTGPPSLALVATTSSTTRATENQRATKRGVGQVVFVYFMY